MSKKTCVIFNPNAGRLSNVAGVPVSKNLLFHTLNQMRVDEWDIIYQQTEKPEDIYLFSKEAVKDGFENLLIVGGDGSMGQASEALINSDTALGTLPAGSANVWAQQLGMTGLKITNLNALDLSMKKMINANRKKMDMGFVNKKSFLFWASFGFDARVVYEVENNRGYRQFTELQYAREVIKKFYDWKGIELEITLDGQKISGNYSFAIITNIRQYAGGFVELSPNAIFDDGEMDLWLIKHKDISTTLMNISALLLGNHKDNPDIQKHSFSKLYISAEKELFYQLDGEPQVPLKKYEVNVKQKCLNVLIPNDIKKNFYTNQ